MNCLEMEKQYGWFKSLCIIAMYFTDLSGDVNSLCLIICWSYINFKIIFILQGSISAILVDLPLNNRTDVQLLKITTGLTDLKVF